MSDAELAVLQGGIAETLGFTPFAATFAVERQGTTKSGPRAVSTWSATGHTLTGQLVQPNQQERQQADQAQYPLTDILDVAGVPDDVRPGDRLTKAGEHYYVLGLTSPQGLHTRIHLERRGDA